MRGLCEPSEDALRTPLGPRTAVLESLITKDIYIQLFIRELQ